MRTSASDRPSRPEPSAAARRLPPRLGALRVVDGGQRAERRIEGRLALRHRGDEDARCSVRPGASGAPTSTSTTSPGTTTDDPAGVPVRITSPGSSVKCCDRSATSWASGNSSPAVVSSCASVAVHPGPQAQRGRGRRARAAISAGPIGVKPSPPLERTLEPLSFARRSYRPKSFAAVTQPTWLQASPSETRRAVVPMTSAISPSKASSSVPAGRSMVPPGRRDRARRLEEVGRVGGAPAALVGAGGVADVDGDDLARPAGERREPGIRGAAVAACGLAHPALCCLRS